MVLCMIFAHVYGHDGFQSMVVSVLGSSGKSLCICDLCVMLSHCLFFVF